ncbi:MAG: lysophospholipid acyltransferase family protein [Bacteroidales bacterium]|jgi:KDO2-lipid IV(A) lauroyltransferase|nr:lysophospholipid acyltransferase family protein [Bacteroidales bacterium]
MKRVLNGILFYFLLIPLSLLPMRVLYCIADFLAFVLRDVLKYRRKVVKTNLQKSFTNLSSKEISIIERKFYSHLADIFLEAIKALTISKKQVMKRYKCLNPELLQTYFEKNQSVILVSAHYNNWEYMVLSLGMQFRHHGIGVGKAMSNKVFEVLMHQKRTRYGTEVVYANNVRQCFEGYEKKHIPCAYMMLFDQSPNDVKRSYITDFLNQRTAVIFGPEHYAKKYNYPVLFYGVQKVKRGYYTFEIQSVNDFPQNTKYGEITEKCLQELTKLINNAPQFWLWSHRRWKHQPA